ncbi:MFS transporter [Paenibacillus sp. PAMC21692]|uniref:MFS transporter n=1 Tax=Paenibacillus sp. PAMC21692 TaxID=2762320 RepID=UPI00164E5FB4|nr:MFS transporter [Paenibacillus sp. PAMC21692]QNK56398.1 MFS transporter [Paenibacillus sp. PAMC21692]
MVKIVADDAAVYKLDGKKAVPWILFVMFFGVLNETVFNISTPKVAAQYDLSSTGVSWIITVFFITFGIGTVVYGKLADMYSVRSLIANGLVIYALGALVGFLMQQWYAAVIIGRAIQGVGASAIPALIMIVTARYFTPSDRSKLFGILASTSSFAIGIGPVVGGIISAYIHWSALFLLSLIPLLSIPFFLRKFPVEVRRAGSMDIPGLLMLAVSVTSFVIWFTDPSWLLLLLGIAALGAFIWRIRTAAEPFIQPELFRSRSYRTGLLAGTLLFVVMTGMPFVLPLFLSGVHGFNTDRIGLMLFPGSISAVVFGTLAGRLAARKGANYVAYIGLLLVGAALLGVMFMMTQWIWYIAFMLIPLYIGFAFVQTGLYDKLAQVIPLELMGVGMGLFGLVSQISGAFGTAAIAQVLNKEWLGLSIVPMFDLGASTAYWNLLIGFIVLIILAWLLYRLAFGYKRDVS